MKVFGIGLNKTGTKTLGECFRILGFNNKSYDFELLKDYSLSDYNRIFGICSLYDSFEDWPWPLVYKDLDSRFHDARFILTLRKDPDTWFTSLCKHADMTGPTEARKIVYGYAMPHNHKFHHLKIYKNHTSAVMDHFLSHPERLLIVNWENGDGWGKLCSFLNIENIPSVNFPHMNRSGTK